MQRLKSDEKHLFCFNKKDFWIKFDDLEGGTLKKKKVVNKQLSVFLSQHKNENPECPAGAVIKSEGKVTEDKGKRKEVATSVTGEHGLCMDLLS